jgi:hypothetical protein
MDSIEPVLMPESGLTPTLIEKLKRKHGPLWLIEVAPEASGDTALEFVFKKPDRKILSAVAKVGRTDEVEAGYVLLVNCLVWGEKEYLDDIQVFSALSQKMEALNAPRIATIKNL